MPLYRTERVIASLTVAWVIILTTYMIFQDHALSQTSIYFLKIILSLSGAVMLATLPGFFDVNYSLGGFSVRAAGGAAAFVFIFTQSPNLPSLNADPAQQQRAPAVQDRRHTTGSDRLSSRTDVYPVLMTLAIAPGGSIPVEARPRYEGVLFEAGIDGDSGAIIGLRPAHSFSLGEAVSADIRAGVKIAAAFVRRAMLSAKAWLDMAAQGIRSAVSRLITAAKALLDLVPSENKPLQTIGVLTEDRAAGLEDATGILSSQGAGGLLAALQDLGASLASGLGATGNALVAVTDRTVDALVAAVNSASQGLLQETQSVLGGVTGVAGTAAGNLAPALTEPIADLADNTVPTAATLVNGALQGAESAGKGLLDGLNAQVNAVTEQLNAVSPAIIAKIDADFAAAHTVADLTKGIDSSLLSAPLGQLDGDLRGIAGNLPGQDDSAFDPNRDKPFSAGRLTDQFANGITGGASGSANGEPAAAGRGGLVSSTVNTAESAVGKVLSPLKRR
jgi:hypothetical protein